ncbi:MAG: hypothetical protein B6U89_02405, partial [Desulfurococcales archaeon ex4484_58]
IFKPKKPFHRRDLIEDALKDLDPGVREQAREILESLSEDILKDKSKIKEILKKRGLLNQ